MIERTFSPEFRNRLDAWVPFKALDMEVIKSIVDKFINELNGQLAEKRVLVKLPRRRANGSPKTVSIRATAPGRWPG